MPSSGPAWYVRPHRDKISSSFVHVFQLVKIMCRSFPSRLRVVGDGVWLNTRKGVGWALGKLGKSEENI